MAKAPETPAPVEAEAGLTTPDPTKLQHGAQVVLTGIAQAAARGAMADSIEGNTAARDAAIGRGEAADGTTPDASTPDGRLPPDTALGAGQAVYSAPGLGEGKPGSRPGDEEVAKAEMDAAAKRETARDAAAKVEADKK